MPPLSRAESRRRKKKKKKKSGPQQRIQDAPRKGGGFIEAETLLIPGAKKIQPGANNRIMKERHAASHKVLKMMPPSSILDSILASKVRLAIKPQSSPEVTHTSIPV